MNKGIIAGVWMGVAALANPVFCLGQIKAKLESYNNQPGETNSNAPGKTFTYGSVGTVPKAVTFGGKECLKVTWQGKESYGGWGKGLGLPIELEQKKNYLNITLANTSPEAITLQLILQEDDNKDGVFREEDDDAWTSSIRVEPSAGWQLFSVPLAAFTDQNKGGDGVFNVSPTEGSLLAFMINFPDLSGKANTWNWYVNEVSLSDQELFMAEAPLAAAVLKESQPKKTAGEWQHVGDAVGSDKMLLGKNRLFANISYSMGRFINPAGLGNAVKQGEAQPVELTENQPAQSRPMFRNALVLTTRARLFEEVYLSGTFFKNFNPNTIQVWTADYSYSLGRYNWRPNTFSYGYENYMDNRYDDHQSFIRKFLQGYYFVSYGHELPARYLAPLKIDNTSNVRISYFVRYASHYRDINNNLHGGLLEGKPVAGLSLRYTIARSIYVESAVYQYIKPASRKMPWDPDYSYGFGYFNYKSFRASVTYANWIANRFPWNPKELKPYGVLDGDLRLTLNFNW